jgi:hypothetical protein
MKINSINNIINFRFFKKYKKWDYPKNTNLKLLDEYPKIFFYFKKVIWVDEILDFKDNKNNNILCNSTKLKYLSDNINYIGKHNILIVAGSDYKLSNCIEYIDKINNYFKIIYFEAKDICYKNVKMIPMGLNFAYTLRNGGDENILKIINRDNLPKSELVTTAFGSKWIGLNKTIKARIDLIKFCQDKDWLIKNNWTPDEYYKELSKYKYFICPTGNGIQAPKIFESLLVKTIPIVLNLSGFQDIKSYGYPILIINNYEELNPSMLDNLYKTEFKNIDWDKIIYDLTIEGFVKKFKL